MWVNSRTSILSKFFVITILTATLFSIVTGDADAIEKTSHLMAEGTCLLKGEQCMEEGRIRFHRYRQEKAADIRQSNQGYRMPSVPVGFFHPFRTEYSVLLVHGLNDSPYYMADLAQVLYRYGYNVITVLLPGHGTDPNEMINITAEHWRSEVSTGLEMALLVGEKTVLGGFSLGGALAIDAVLRHKNIHALLLFSPAIRLRFFDSLYGLACISAMRSVSISSKVPVNPVKYKYRMGNGICQVHRVLTQLHETEQPARGQPGIAGKALYQAASKISIPTFAAMTYADARISPDAIVEFVGSVTAPAVLTTFGSAPDEQLPKLANGGQIVHISDQQLPHSFLVRRSNKYNGQANPFFDRVAELLVSFLDANL